MKDLFKKFYFIDLSRLYLKEILNFSNDHNFRANSIFQFLEDIKYFNKACLFHQPLS